MAGPEVLTPPQTPTQVWYGWSLRENDHRLSHRAMKARLEPVCGVDAVRLGTPHTDWSGCVHPSAMGQKADIETVRASGSCRDQIEFPGLNG